MKTLLSALSLLLVSCGTPLSVVYENPATGISAGYSSKGGLAIGYRPLSEK